MIMSNKHEDAKEDANEMVVVDEGDGDVWEDCSRCKIAVTFVRSKPRCWDRTD